MTDARFEDAPLSDQPLRIKAESTEDLVVLSSLIQDAVMKVGDIHWLPRARRLIMIVHRFRWEDRDHALQQQRPFERVQSALTINDVTAVRVRDVAQDHADAVLALLSLDFFDEPDGSGRVSISMADGGEVGVEAECLNVTLTDLTQPWEAKATSAPSHPE